MSRTPPVGEIIDPRRNPASGEAAQADTYVIAGSGKNKTTTKVRMIQKP